MHLDLREREVLREVRTGDDKVGALLDRSPARGLVGFEDDNGKVFGTEEGGRLCADEVESRFEPLARLSETREGPDLSETQVLEPTRVRSKIHVLLQTRLNISQSPVSLSQVFAQRMSEVIVLHNMPQRMHPALQTTIHKVPNPRDIIRSNIAVYDSNTHQRPCLQNTFN